MEQVTADLCETLCHTVTGTGSSTTSTSQMLTMGMGILFLVSEAMGMTNRIPQNSVLQLVFETIKKVTIASYQQQPVQEKHE